jgi:hypothetical protein
MTNVFIPSLVSFFWLAGCGHPLPVPEVHRISANACPAGVRPPADGCNRPAAVGMTCTADSDCTDGANGRCLPPMFNGICECSYDECNSDADCAADALCACGDAITGGRSANSCLPSNCRKDSDCGAGQYCAPSVDPDCGNRSGVTNYACTTPSDECRSDRDCGSDGGDRAPYCAYKPEVGHRICSTSICTG